MKLKFLLTVSASMIMGLAFAQEGTRHHALKGPIDDAALTWAPSKWGADDRIGSANHTKNSANIARALSTIKQNKSVTIGKHYHSEAPGLVLANGICTSQEHLPVARSEKMPWSTMMN